jgi:hypothetical protein
VQEELVVNTGAKTRSHIRWIEDCIYDLRQIWTNNKEKRKMNESVTRVKIIKTYDNATNILAHAGTVLPSIKIVEPFISKIKLIKDSIEKSY